MARARNSLLWFAAPLLWISTAQARSDRVDNIKEASIRLHGCWKPPPPSRANPDVEITAIVTFRRDGTILGRPKITYESENASDSDRLEYRIAVMEALQRCTPMHLPKAWAAPSRAGLSPSGSKFENRHPNR